MKATRGISLGCLIAMALLLIPVGLHSGSTELQHHKTATKSKRAVMTIHALKQMAPDSGSYNTEGYVVLNYLCPPCPPGAECKPCLMESNIVISESHQLLHGYNTPLTDKQL